MKYLGIDASSTSTGWALFDDDKLLTYGVIKPDGDDWRERIANQGPILSKIINRYKPDRIIMEDVPLKSVNPKVLVILGAVQGFIYGLVAQYHTEIHFVSPSTWRSPLELYDGTREGTKRKELKRKSVELANELFGLSLKYISPNSKFNEDDISDAILVAYSQIKPRKKE